jgi:hypothetical protein
MTVFYRWFDGHGRIELADILRTPEPFHLTAPQIVERIIAAGCTPDVSKPYENAIATLGVITRFERDGQWFIVAIDEEGETILVQERREDGYDVSE